MSGAECPECERLKVALREARVQLRAARPYWYSATCRKEINEAIETIGALLNEPWPKDDEVVH